MKAETLFGFGFIAIVIGLAAILMPPLADITDQHLGLLMLALVIVAIMLGFPAAFTLMGVGVMFSLYAFGGELGLTLNLIVQRAFATMSNDVLVAVPLFIFMGYIVERAALVERLFKALHLALAWMPGALAVATLATCALFATATGIVGAVVTVMGLLALPVMLRMSGHSDSAVHSPDRLWRHRRRFGGPTLCRRAVSGPDACRAVHYLCRGTGQTSAQLRAAVVGQSACSRA